jgi:hypothetical protein
MFLASTRVGGQKPQRGDLFKATAPSWDVPNPSAVTCGDSTCLVLSGAIRVTPLGFDRNTKHRVTINRSPRRGFRLPRARAGKAQLSPADAGGESVRVLGASGLAPLAIVVKHILGLA